MKCISAEEGPFLQRVGSTIWLTPEIDNIAGTVHMGCSLTTPPGADGNGVLAYINFQCIAVGSSILHPYDTNLLNSALDSIPHATLEGQVNQIDPGWYWKSSYVDYAPSGVPDFTQR